MEASRKPLDLSAPALDSPPDVPSYSEAGFPSRPNGLSALDSRSERSQAPGLHFQGGRAQQLVDGFRRDGLPLARLWETRSSLLSLGLNQSGKPGLWLIQKTH
jgi:hypothetical protein